MHCTRAAAGGHLEVLKWAREHDCPWNEASVRVSAYRFLNHGDCFPVADVDDTGAALLVGGSGYSGGYGAAPLALGHNKPEGLRPDLEASSSEAAAVAEELNDRAVQLFGAKNFAPAYDLYTEAVRLQPDKARGLLMKHSTDVESPSPPQRVCMRERDTLPRV